jgi:TetR/AcrR family transcriptional repressor of nem operon
MKAPGGTRKQLLTSALSLVWEQSYGAVSVEDICQEAHANKGSFYHFFPSKTDLTIAAVEEHWRNVQPLLDGVFSAQFEPLERLRRFCDWVYERQHEKALATGRVCGCPFISLASEVSTQQEELRRKLQQILNCYVRYFASTLREAASEGSLEVRDFQGRARELYGYVIGVLVQARIQNDLEIVRQMKAGMARLLGISPDEFK